MYVSSLPVQPPAWISYAKVSWLLLGALLLFIAESVWYGYELSYAIRYRGWLPIAFWGWSFMFSFIHIFLVIMDSWSRFQNYKRVKDQFFQYGFKARIADAYIVSRCQRSAVMVAAQELGLEKQLSEHYEMRGVKWFHFIPYFMLQDPLFFFKKAFWSKTFIEKHYKSKFDYRQLNLNIT
jgi:hypothetical protein